MSNLKRIACLFMSCVALITAASALLLCGGCRSDSTDKSSDTHIVTTCFPAYDFVRRLIADCDGWSVSCLIKPGTESHSYDPSATDILAVADSSLFVRIGAGGDAWADRIITAANIRSDAVIAMTDCVDSLLEIEEDNHDEHDETHTHGEDDPHVWTSPHNALAIVHQLASRLTAIADKQSDIDAISNALTSFAADLEALDNDYREYFTSLTPEQRVLVFGDRFPFRYLAAEYDISCFAAYTGCAEESEPAASTVASLIDKVRNDNIPTVFYVEFSNHTIADAIADAADANTALLHSCHNVTQEEFDSGITYISRMQLNLDTLKSCLSGN